MGLWFPGALTGGKKKPKPKPTPKPKPRGELAYALMLLRESTQILGGLAVVMVLPWP